MLYSSRLEISQPFFCALARSLPIAPTQTLTDSLTHSQSLALSFSLSLSLSLSVSPQDMTPEAINASQTFRDKSEQLKVESFIDLRREEYLASLRKEAEKEEKGDSFHHADPASLVGKNDDPAVHTDAVLQVPFRKSVEWSLLKQHFFFTQMLH